MFRCQKCNKVVGPRIQPKVIITELREKTYPPRYKKKKEKEENPASYHRKRGPKQSKKLIDKGGKGYEIIKEIRVCSSCFKEMMKEDK